MASQGLERPVGAAWRNHGQQPPLAGHVERVEAQQFAGRSDLAANRNVILAKPDFDGGIGGADWAANYPDDALALIFSEDRSTDIEDYFVLPITFDCIAREFAYPSDHQDLAYAGVCAELAQLLYALAGVRQW